MIDADIILEKSAIVHRCLKRIVEMTGLKASKLDDMMIQDAFVLNLQRAIQAAMDLAAHVVSEEKLGMPTSLKDQFKFLAEGKIIDASLSKHLQAMVGFRNIAVHQYQELNVDILKKILQNHLKDLEDFTKTLLKHYCVSEKVLAKKVKRRK
ncbi:MAG: DUF86 domain-containing protein [Chlamydiae bacterium]|nr:DUF86 domain-containing protein [Chlamydiota bacterium]MBI3277975.1 DUF86 domain-containing protein [Chlamydiota bacterium]